MVRRTTFTYAGLVVTLLIIANCGGGGGGGGPAGPDPNVPVISDLEIRALDPEVANRNIRYVVAFRVVDRDGDVIGGECEVLLNGRSIGRVRIDPAPATPPDLTEGAIGCVFVVQASAPQQIDGRVRVFDRAGHQSNELGFVLGIREGVRGALPESTRGAPEGRMESATIRR